MTQPQPNHSLEEIVPFEGIKVIAFDADDTLWNCQSHFAAAERRYCDLLKPYADAAEVSASLFRTETANMPLLGYGSKAFTLSLIENAVAVSGGRISGSVIGEIVELGKGLLNIPTAPLTGVTLSLGGIHQGRVARPGEQTSPFTSSEILQPCGDSFRQDAPSLPVALPQSEYKSFKPAYGWQLVQERHCSSPGDWRGGCSRAVSRHLATGAHRRVSPRATYSRHRLRRCVLLRGTFILAEKRYRSHKQRI